MSQCFADAAARLAGLSAQMLGWRPDEFWSATPADLVLALGTSAQNAGVLTREQLNSLMEGDTDG